MRHRRLLAGAFAVTASAVLVAWTAFHLELTDSHPKAGQTMVEAPAEIWLRFSVVPDTARSSFSVRGPEGNVALGDIAPGASPEVLRAPVAGPMPAGTYTVSWVGAPMDDHAVRGRFTFTIGAHP